MENQEARRLTVAEANRLLHEMRMKRDALCKNAILDSVSGKPEEEKCKSKRRSGSAYCQECSDRSRALKTKE